MLLIELTLDGVEEVLAFALDFLFRLLIFELVLQFFGLTLELARFILEVFFGLAFELFGLALKFFCFVLELVSVDHCSFPFGYH